MQGQIFEPAPVDLNLPRRTMLGALPPGHTDIAKSLYRAIPRRISVVCPVAFARSLADHVHVWGQKATADFEQNPVKLVVRAALRSAISALQFLPVRLIAFRCSNC